MHGLSLVLFTIAAGLTLSGIVANLYRLITTKAKNIGDTWIYYPMMVLAGPSVLFDNATCSFRKKECGRMAWAFALGLATYWAMVLGAILLDVVVTV
ncbi:MAG TPA: hypothetical protein VGH23_12005 [Rhizomicrobium sp.]|jgi:hypothetical protein